MRLRSPFLLPDQCQVPTELHLFYCYTIEVSVTISVYEAKPFYSFGIWALVSNECEAQRDLLRQVKLNRTSRMCNIFGPVKIGSMAQDGRRMQKKTNYLEMMTCFGIEKIGQIHLGLNVLILQHELMAIGSANFFFRVFSLFESIHCDRCVITLVPASK